MKVALVQMSSQADKESNLAKSLKLLHEALKLKPDIVVFPEYQMYSPDYSDPAGLASASESAEGNFVSKFVDEARTNSTNILINFAEGGYGRPRPFNTSLLIDDLGMISGRYSKLHLFDAYSKKESSLFDFGRTDLKPFKVGGVSLGLQICYDLRFPEPARYLALQGIKILSYQAGWYAGERKLDIWRNLLRTRAIENGVFVIGTGQSGPDFTGHSMVITPYGDVLDETGNDETVLTRELDLAIIDEYAREVPMLKQRRKDAYDVSGL